MSTLVIAEHDNGSLKGATLNAVTAALLDEIERNDTLTGEELLRQLAARINYPDTDALVAHGAAALQEMRQLEILAGTRKTT